MSVALLRTGFQAWLATASGLTTIRANQDPKSRPAMPYLTYQVVETQEEGYDNIVQVGATVGYVGYRKATISVNWFGTGANDGLAALRQKRYDESLIASANTAGIAVYDMDDVKDLSAVRDSGFEERSQCDFSVRYSDQTTPVAAGYIDNLEVEGEIDNLEFDLEIP